MPEQIPWMQIPENVKKVVYIYSAQRDQKSQWEMANSIMQSMKAEQERAMNHGFSKGCGEGYWSEDGPDFENWYENTYLK